MSKRYVYAAYVNGKSAIDEARGFKKNKFQTEEEAKNYLQRFLGSSMTPFSHPITTVGSKVNFGAGYYEIKKEIARGRPAGANSFVTVRMADLQQYLGPDGVVKVSKIWLSEIGLTVKEAVATIEATEERQETEKPIEFKMVNFDEERDSEEEHWNRG